MNAVRRFAPLVLAALITACAGPAPVPVPNVDGNAQDEEFGLRIHASQAVFRSSEPIVVDATLSYLGRAASADIYGDSGVVGFGLKQLDGRLHMSAVSDLMCTATRVDRLVPVHRPFSKSGGFTGEDPDAAFWRAYFADPVLHLPPGTWQITAYAGFTTGEGCSGPQHALTATVPVLVIP